MVNKGGGGGGNTQHVTTNGQWVPTDITHKIVGGAMAHKLSLYPILSYPII